MSRFVTRRRVEFADTDMGGICHFSRYFVFMETAEHEFLESLGTSVSTEIDGRPVGWPRVAVSCEFRSPARFGDLLEFEVTVERKGRTSLTYRIAVSCDGRAIADGRVTAVCCALDPAVGRIRPIPIPAEIVDKIVVG